MVGNNALGIAIYEKAFRGNIVDAHSGLIRPNLLLTEEDMRQLYSDFSKDENQSFNKFNQQIEKYLVGTNESLYFQNSSIIYLNRYLSIGTIVQLERECGDVIRLVYTGDLGFLVISDNVPQLLPCDYIFPLQWIISCNKEVAFAVKRNGKEYPSHNKVLRFNDLTSLKIKYFNSDNAIPPIGAVDSALFRMSKCKTSKEMLDSIEPVSTQLFINELAVVNIANAIIESRNSRNIKTILIDFANAVSQDVSIDDLMEKMRRDTPQCLYSAQSHRNTPDKELLRKIRLLTKENNKLKEELNDSYNQLSTLKKKLEKYEI